MSILKRILFSLFVIATVILAIWAYSYLKKTKKPKIEALTLLPDNCEIYLSTANFFELNKKINSQSLIIDKLKSDINIGNFVNTLQFFDSILITNTLLIDEFKNTTIHFATYNQNKNWLCAFNIKQLGNEINVLNEFIKIVNASKTSNNYYEVNSNLKFVFTLKSGILFLANTSGLIDEALNTENLKLINNKNFKAYKTNLEENNSLSIYVNHNLIALNTSKNLLNINALSTSGNSFCKIDIEPNQLKINGFLKPDSNYIVSNLSHQQPQTINFTEFLPISTIEFSSFGFTNFNQICQKSKRSDFWKLVNDSALFNLQNDFYDNINHQIIQFKLNSQEQNFCLVPVMDSIKAFEQLVFMCDSATKIISEKIYKLKYSKNKLQLFYPFFKVETNYVTYFNSYLYFSETKAGLEDVINNIKITNINFNQNFVAYKNQQLSEEYNYIYYTALFLNKSVIKNFYNINANYCANLKHFCFSLTNAKNNFKFRSNLMYQTEQLNNLQNVLWTTLIDTLSFQQPYSFKNHLTNENEILIQDELNNLYLINAKGNRLWKKKINEQLQSKIYTVDIFKNNKFQLLFNTKNYLHLIDRNGNYVQGYPVKLPAQATAPLALFDYDNDKNYRLFVSCKNKNIYNYTLYGIKQQCFKPIITDNEINLPIQYVKVGLSDYLVAIDKMGKIYTYSRKGEARIGLKNKTIENCSAFYVDASNTVKSTFLVYVDDKNNLLNKISFADKKEVIKLSTQVTDASFSFNLLDDNRTMDVLITTPNQLLAHDFNGNLIFEKNNDNQLSQSFFYADENNSYTLSFSSNLNQFFIQSFNSQKIITINSNALPLISNLFNNNKKYIIYSYNAQLNCIAL